MLVEALAVRAKEAAKILGIGRSHFLALNRNGKIPASSRLGGAVLWNVAELRAWAANGMPHREKWEAMKSTGQVAGTF